MATNKNFVVKNGLEVGGNINITGNITQSGLSFPNSDGTYGQYLQTDGDGNLTWNSVVSSFSVSNGTTTDQVNTGETLTFTGGTNITVSVTDNGITFNNDIADSDDITEGTSNLFFTETRAVDAIEGHAHLTIDGGTLYVDTVNNYVGIGDTSPQHKLDVAGGIGINGTEVITSAGTYTGPVLDGSLTVGGSLVGPLSDAKVQYGTAYSGTPAQGSFFFDSLNQKLKVYTGSSFVDAVPAGSGGGGGGDLTDAVATFEKFQYTVSSQTNAISGSDDNSNTLAYVVDGSQNVEVYLNGVKQFEGVTNDYVATTGTSVTFTYNIPAGSVVDIQVYELLSNDAFYLKTETYTQAETNSQIATGLSSYTATGADTNYVNVAGDTMSGALSIGVANGEVLTLNNTDSSIGGGESLTFSLEYPNAAGSSTGWRHISRYAGGAYQLARNIDNAGYATALTVLENGNVGIGTESPAEKVEVNGSFKLGNLKIQNAHGGRIGFNRNTANGDIYDSNFAAFQINGAYAGADFMAFEAYTSGGVGTDAMAIRDNGNVGIGTTNPSTKLHVEGNIRASSIYQEGAESSNNAFVMSQGVNTTRASVALWAKDQATYPGQVHIVSHSANASADSGKIMFWDYNGSAWNANGAWDKDGNLGVGTTSPDHKLDVNGDINTNGYNVKLGGSNGLRIIGATGDGGWAAQPGVSTTNASEFRFHADTGDMDVWVDGYIRANNGVKGAFVQFDGYTEFTLTGNGASSTWSPSGLPGNVYVSASVFLSSTDPDQSDHFNVHYGPNVFSADSWGDTHPAGSNLPVTHAVSTNLGDSQDVLAGHYGAWSHAIFKTSSSGSIVSTIKGTNAGSGVAIRIQGYWMESSS